jgi:hypothetical protein
MFRVMRTAFIGLLDLDEQVKSRLDSLDAIDSDGFFLGEEGVFVGEVASLADLPKNDHGYPNLVLEVKYESVEVRNGTLGLQHV